MLFPSIGIASVVREGFGRVGAASSCLWVGALGGPGKGRFFALGGGVGGESLDWVLVTDRSGGCGCGWGRGNGGEGSALGNVDVPATVDRSMSESETGSLGKLAYLVWAMLWADWPRLS